MKQEFEQPNFDFDQWTEGGDIFYRPQDKMQFHRSLKAITEENLGLAVAADNERVLSHYCRLMTARLRSSQDFQLETLLPSTTDTLLKRFNQIMATMPIDQALRPPSAESKVSLMIVNDAHLVADEQWLLLSQLLSDFPGVNIRLILFIDINEWPSFEQPLKLFWKRLHVWKLEAPSSMEAKDLLITAEQNGYRNQVETLLSGLTNDLNNSHECANKEILLKSILIEHKNGDSRKDLKKEAVKGTTNLINKESKIKPSIFTWSILIALVLGASGVVMSISNPEYVNQFNIQTRNLFSTDLDVSKNLPQLGEKLIFKEPQILTGPIEKNNSSTDVIEVTITSKAEEDSVIVRPTLSSRDIVYYSKDSDYFVQHVLFQEESTALDYKDQTLILNNAMLVELSIGAGIVFGLVSGPFESREASRMFLDSSGLSKDGWIQNASQMKAKIR